MRLKILGCSGGIGGALRTTSMLLDDDILIDAGTGVADLAIEEMSAIDHIFLTHSHLDHIACVPLMIDTVIGLRDKHITIHATRETWQTLRDHIFNWKIWPDLTAIPDEADPIVRFNEISIGKTVILGDRKITPLPVNHTVPAVGFRIDSGASSLVFSGDTTSSDDLFAAINKIDNLKYLVIETSFSDKETRLAVMSMHLSSSMLIAELDKLHRPVQVFITHLKPGEGEEIMRQINASASTFTPLPLQTGQIFEL